MPQFFQTMPCRVQDFQATLDGYIKTNKYLVAFNDACNGGANIFTPSGTADHLGTFFYIPFYICRLHSVLSYHLECTLEGHDDSVTCMALDANFLFSGSDDTTIRVWNLVHVTEA